MSKLKLLAMIVFLTVMVAPFTVHGAGPKTFLGVSGISFDYMPFWYEHKAMILGENAKRFYNL